MAASSEDTAAAPGLYRRIGNFRAYPYYVLLLGAILQVGILHCYHLFFGARYPEKSFDIAGALFTAGFYSFPFFVLAVFVFGISRLSGSSRLVWLNLAFALLLAATDVPRWNYVKSIVEFTERTGEYPPDDMFTPFFTFAQDVFALILGVVSLAVALIARYLKRRRGGAY
ncbi:MAG: hypothetical protein OEV59_07440 [Deltaproteobacteria bacterium]|nr:hypothetical protein [Deltaproteobacteria bacterium]